MLSADLLSSGSSIRSRRVITMLSTSPTSILPPETQVGLPVIFFLLKYQNFMNFFSKIGAIWNNWNDTQVFIKIKNTLWDILKHFRHETYFYNKEIEQAGRGPFLTSFLSLLYLLGLIFAKFKLNSHFFFEYWNVVFYSIRIKPIFVRTLDFNLRWVCNMVR